MKAMQFDLNGVPPSHEDIERKKGELEAAKSRLSGKLRLLKVSAGLLLVGLIIGLAILYRFGHVEILSPLMFYSLVFSIVVLLSGLVVDKIAPYSLAGASLVLMVLVPSFIFYSNISEALMPVALIVVSSLCVIISCMTYNDSIWRDLRNLYQLSFMLDTISLHHCPDLVQWCEQDDTVRLYQNTVAASGRSLTEGEYAAAKEWMSSARITEVSARNACERLATPIQRSV